MEHRLRGLWGIKESCAGCAFVAELRDTNYELRVERTEGAQARGIAADAPTKAQRSAPMVRVLRAVGAGADSPTAAEMRSMKAGGSPKYAAKYI